MVRGLLVLAVILVMSFSGILPVHADTSIGSLPSDNSATGNSYEVFGTDATGPDQDGRVGVCMVAAASGTVTDLDFWVRTDGTPISATMQGEVYSTTGSISNYPSLGTGCAGQSTLIATSTNSYDMSTLTSSFVKKSFTFNSGTVVAGSKYMAILYAHFTVYTHAHFFIQFNTGNGNAAMANVDNFCCSPQGSLSQAQNDADEHLCSTPNGDPNQCTAFNAYVSSPLAVDFSWTLSNGTTVTFTSAVSGGIGPYQYIWTFGDGSPFVTGGSTQVHTYPSGGPYTATLAVEDSLNATASVSHTLVGFTMSADQNTVFKYCQPYGCPYAEQDTSVITITSLNGFSGTITISYIAPNPAAGSLITGPSSAYLPLGGSVTITVGIGAFPTTANTNYWWVVQGQSAIYTANVNIDDYYWVCHRNCPL